MIISSKGGSAALPAKPKEENRRLDFVVALGPHHLPPPLGRSHFQGPQWPSHKAQKAGLSGGTVDLHFAPNPHQAVGQPRLRATRLMLPRPPLQGQGWKGLEQRCSFSAVLILLG